MVEVINQVAEVTNSDEGKQVNDRSYKKPDGESGIGSQVDTSNTSTEDTTGFPTCESTGESSGLGTSLPPLSVKWENFDGEIMNLATVNQYLQSSNVPAGGKMCDISTIEHAEGTPKLRKGNMSIDKYIKCLMPLHIMFSFKSRKVG